MSVVDRQKFIAGLIKSGVLSDDVLQRWQSGISPDADSMSLAKDLVAKKLATNWQAKMLLKGASKLTIGNFLLTERLGKSELGDFFAAFHPQLSRNVSIQYLTAELSRDPETRKKLFSLGSKLAELDHSNLLHIFDVDEEGDRIYLVSEVGNATPLTEHLAKNTNLTCPEAAKLILGSLKGIEYAHSCGVVHSGISLKSVFVKLNGEAKIGELTRFAVSNAIAENPVGPESDLAALSEVAKLVLQRLPADQRETHEFATLKNSILLLLKDRDAAEVGLSELAESHVVSSDVLDSDVLLVAESEANSVGDSPTFNFASQQTTPLQSVAARRKPVPQKTVAPEPETPEKLSFVKRNPVAVISAAVVAGLLLIGGGVFATTSMMAKPLETADASGIESGLETKLDPKTSLLSDDAPVVSEGMAIDPEANRKAIEAMFKSNGGETSVAKQTTPVSHEVKPPEQPAAPAMAAKAAVQKPADQKTEEPAEAEPAVEFTVEKSEPQAVSTEATEEPVEPAEIADSKPAKPEAQRKQAKTQELKKGENPFTKFAKSVDLPGLDTEGQVSFGKLILEKRHLLGAEILSATSVHRSKPVFSMERSSDDRQSWDIGYSPRKKVKPTTIAKLQKTADSLKFNWLPAAAEFPAADALRNCRIKLSTPQDSHWLSLRKPIKIEGFKLDKKTGVVEVELDIPSLPQTSAISGTLSRMPIKVNRENRRERLSVEPTEFVGSVARMHFTADRDRYISLDVSAVMKKTMKLRAAIIFQPNPLASRAPIKDLTTLKANYTDPIRFQAQQLIRQAEGAQQKLSEAVKKQPKNKKMSKEKQKAYMKPFLDAAGAAIGKAELTDVYDRLIPETAGRDIPVVIVYKLNNQHRIVLAYSGPVEGIE